LYTHAATPTNELARTNHAPKGSSVNDSPDIGNTCEVRKAKVSPVSKILKATEKASEHPTDPSRADTGTRNRRGSVAADTAAPRQMTRAPKNNPIV
jgi:hypothetical protein